VVTRFAVVRLLQTAVVLWGVSTIVFAIAHLSGDPVALMVPQGTPLDVIARMRHTLGLDLPLYVQYGRFLAHLARGDLGMSYVQDAPALRLVLQRLPYTAELATAAFGLAVAAGVPLGAAAGIHRGGWLDRIAVPVILIGQAMPAFWTGLLLILVVSVDWHLLPSSGSGGISTLILPAVTLAWLSLATIARMSRSAVLEEMDKDYVRTAHAKGVAPWRVVAGHVLRNASLPIITVATLDIANLLGGVVITESIFAWPGIGRLALEAIQSRDYTVVQAVVLVGTTIFVVASLVTDLLYCVIDPRIELADVSV
jgi:peptide/nickel transport system permease protein